ncbi:hypothetical protein [Hamadaea tsunoensis]|uniref:hypothetical protein n=1 Tax=Hamadaea tsunoensis TaxID=53368 RepID=UPI00042780A8|nr:hypothetical protein [Hamadaea tsunoensis]
MIFRKTVVDAARTLADALTRRDMDAFGQSLGIVAQAAGRAKPRDCQAAVELLLPVLAAAPLGPGAPVAGIVGSLAGDAPDPLVALPVLVERASTVLEDAAEFLAVYARLGVEPDRGDPDADLRRLSAELTEREAYRLTASFHTADDWTQPVLYLCQRKDVRLALPQRERLTRAVAATAEHLEVSHWLAGLLRVLDDEPLLVLDRATGKGFRLRMSGVGDNFQLHTLLAARLAGDLAVRPLSAAELAAATDGEPQPAGGLTGRFNLTGADGKWIWNEGRPDDIPLLGGVRVVVLDPPPYHRSWNAGRAYPLMLPEFVVEERLPAAEAAGLLSRVAPAATDPAGEPAVATDDLTLLLQDHEYAEVVDAVIAGLLAGRSTQEVAGDLVTRFALSMQDAELAVDRTRGGLVRAGSGNPANRPPREEDPVGWESYQRGIDDPQIIARCADQD